MCGRVPSISKDVERFFLTRANFTELKQRTKFSGKGRIWINS